MIDCENDDTVCQSLNILLNILYKDNGKLLVYSYDRKIVEQAIVDYGLLLQKVKDSQILLYQANQTIDDLHKLLDLK